MVQGETTEQLEPELLELYSIHAKRMLTTQPDMNVYAQGFMIMKSFEQLLDKKGLQITVEFKIEKKNPRMENL